MKILTYKKSQIIAREWTQNCMLALGNLIITHRKKKQNSIVKLLWKGAKCFICLLKNVPNDA